MLELLGLSACSLQALVYDHIVFSLVLRPCARKGSRDQSAEYNFSEICKISQLSTSKSGVSVLNKAAGRAYRPKELFYREC